MAVIFKCSCGQRLKAAASAAGRRAECPICGQAVEVPHRSQTGGEDTVSESWRSSDPLESRVFLDPPSTPPAAAAASRADEPSVVRRMFEALLDPHSIQWMLIIGGALCVLGLVVWLVSLGVFKDPHVLAIVLGAGTLAILGAGWFVTLRTRYHIAGHAITFLGCVLAPLNLWFYHSQNLITVDGHLWVGGVVCSLLYAATVVVLRVPLFMYACEAGVTLTTLLLLADMRKITDAPLLAVFFMALGLISIHAERAFSPSEESDFPRRRFGLPLFWSGHAQIAASLIILLGSQLLGWFADPIHGLFGFEWAGNLLTKNYLLAAAVWLAAVYAYLYSDFVVRKVGVYLALAGFSLVMAEVTLLLGFDVDAEWIIVAMAVTALAINVANAQWVGAYKNLDRVLSPLAGVLSLLPVLWGVVLHLRATSQLAQHYDWTYVTGRQFVVVMLISAISTRVSAYLCRRTSPKASADYFFLSATSVLLAVAGLLRVVGITTWSDQAVWMMLVPIAYLIGARLWRGHSVERPLYWVAQTATAVILAHVFFATLDSLTSFAPMEGRRSSLMLGLVFAEAAAFYFLAGIFRRRSINAYLGAAAACGALWQLMGYRGIDPSYYTMLYAVLGLICLTVARMLGLEQTAVYQEGAGSARATRGRGLAVYQCGNGILIVSCLAAFMQGLGALASHGTWLDLGAILATTAASGVAVVIVPAANWRRIYSTAAVALGAVAFLQLNWLIQLNSWQKLEIFSVVVGLAMLIASHWARFREATSEPQESVTLGLDFGSLLAAIPLLIAVFYHRWFGAGPSVYDEMALITVTLLMLVTGLGWQIRSTTVLGGGALALYLIVMIVSLIHHPQVAIGVYLAAGGAVVFAAGIALSVYRDKLLELPEHVAKREGIFSILNWR